MAYSAQSDLLGLVPEQVLIELSTDEPPFESVDSGNIESAIYQADREIDAYLSRRMSVPLETVPGLIKNLSAKMAVHSLHVRKHILSEVWGREYDRCLAILQDIYDGKKGLGSDDGETEIPASVIRTASRTQKFTAALWETFR